MESEFTPTALEWAAFIVGTLVLVPLGVVGLRLGWRAELPIFSRPPAWWLWGDALWRGWVGAMPVMTGVFILAGLPLFPLAAAYSPDDRTLFLVLATPPLAIFAFGCLFALTIAFFNRPRFLVPPHMRLQKGAVVEWFRRDGPSPGTPENSRRA